MKKWITIMLSLVLALGLVTPLMAEDETTVSFALWDENQKPVFDEIIAKFEEENPGIKVDTQLTPWDQYWTKLDAAMGAETAADVFWMNTYLPKYAVAGVLEPLDSYIEADEIDKDAYVPVVRDAYVLNDQTYALPKGMDTVQVFYNGAIFEKYGVEVPQAGWTWEDMEEIAGQLRDAIEAEGGDEYPIVMELDPQPSYFNFIPQAGGYILSEDGTEAGFDQPGTIDAYKRVLKLMEDKLMPDYVVLSDTKGMDLFLSQKGAILYMGSWQAMNLDEASFAESIGVLPMPTIDGNNISVLGGLGFSMNANAKDKDAAWKLISYLAGEESNRIQAERKVDMPAYIAAQDAYVPNFEHIDAQVFFDVAENGYFFPTSEKVAEWLPIVMDGSAQIFSGAVTPEEGCQMIQEQMQPILDSEQH